jgi:hypothetical protein
VSAKTPSTEGWQRQSVASEPRLSEVVELYESLGFDVLLVPVLEECCSEGADGTCTACFGADEDPSRFQVIYTRPRTTAGSGIPGEGPERKDP